MSKKLKTFIKDMPVSPGVYQFLDSNGEILYIGKAKILKNRIKSYFNKEIGRGPGIDVMMTMAEEIKYVVTESEIEAVLLEADLINKLKPKYNIRLRDDKSFLVIKITKKVQSGGKRSALGLTNEQFPCVELVRFKNVDFADKEAWYFGPYPSGLLLKKSLGHLRKVFPYRDCSKNKFSSYAKKGRPCIYGDIRICSSPCVDWVGPDQYFKNISYLIKFLRGEKKSIISDLKKSMNALSKQHKFEEDALVRDKLSALDHLGEVNIGLRDEVFAGENILFKRIECFDISNMLGQFSVGSMAVFTNGAKDAAEYRRFKIKSIEGANDLAMMKQVLERRFTNEWQKPDLIVIDGGENHINVAKKVLKSMNIQIPIVSIAKGKDRKKNDFIFSDGNLAKYANNNKNFENTLISVRDESHRFAIAYYRKLHQKEMLQ